MPHICYRTKFRGSRSNHLCVRRVPKFFWDARDHPAFGEGVADPLKHTTAVPNFVAVGQVVTELVGGPKNLGYGGLPPPWNVGLSDPLEICFSPLVLTCQIRSFWAVPYEQNYGDLPENFDPSHPAFQGHSRSLEPTRIDRLPMTSY